MKKAIFVFSIFFIVGATFALGFYFLKESKAMTPQTYSSVHDSGIKKTAKATFPNSEEKAKILFVGDMMFDRWIRQISDKRGADFVFQKIKNYLQSEDLVVGNLEGPITNNPSISINSEFGSKENYVFTFPMGTASNLYDENIRMVNIGNNHILNFGEIGLNQTKDYLTKANIDFFGDTGNSDGRFFIKDIKGIKVAFVNYNQFVKNGEQDTLDDLRAVKKMQSDFIVVYTHWGIEFTDKPNERNKELAHKFIDNGADLIIGSHPHVIQTKEDYKGKMIYYSLGNFVFDQYFNPNTQKGLAVQVEIDSQINSNIKEYRIEMKNDGQTVLN